MILFKIIPDSAIFCYIIKKREIIVAWIIPLRKDRPLLAITGYLFPWKSDKIENG
jgi:hypothetical protein